MRVFFEKAGQVFQVGKPARHGGRTPDHFVNRLLQWFNLNFHRGQLNPEPGGSSTFGFTSPSRFFHQHAFAGARGFIDGGDDLHVASAHFTVHLGFAAGADAIHEIIHV